MIHEFKKIDLYEVMQMARRAGLGNYTLRINAGKKPVAYLVTDIPRNLLGQAVDSYSMNLGKRVVNVTLAA